MKIKIKVEIIGGIFIDYYNVRVSRPTCEITIDVKFNIFKFNYNRYMKYFYESNIINKCRFDFFQF